MTNTPDTNALIELLKNSCQCPAISGHESYCTMFPTDLSLEAAEALRTLTEQLEQAEQRGSRICPWCDVPEHEERSEELQAQTIIRLHAQLEQYKWLLIEAEGLLCDPCGGVPANTLAEKIIAHMSTPPI